ncbi:unnamed protein product [Clonostachys solani]|uniref:Uncharacterized protein n=1 Tax=Clonostachys solani TaxID=160281 RepID=A0A9N9Z317_9HYPO|nr:unnamed protein product [Clonostachys solani]
MYFWDILQDYFLPTRARGVGVDAETEEAVDLDEPQGEATLSRLIVKGTTGRASISWGNTFLKWLVDIIFGTMWKTAVSLLMSGFIGHRGERMSVSSFLIGNSMTWVARFIHLSNIISFITFIAIPTPQRPLFRTGTGTLISILYTSLSKVAFTGISKSEFKRKFMMQMTESLRLVLAEKEKTGLAYLVDELQDLRKEKPFY